MHMRTYNNNFAEVLYAFDQYQTKCPELIRLVSADAIVKS